MLKSVVFIIPEYIPDSTKKKVGQYLNSFFLESNLNFMNIGNLEQVGRKNNRLHYLQYMI